MPPNVSLILADCDAWAPAALSSLLVPDECARAARYRHDDDRRRFVVRRGLLRRLLGERLGAPPAEVPLRAGPNGKPLVDVVDGPVFNLARSGALALFAFADVPPETSAGSRWAGAVGVDLERVARDRRSLADLERIAGHFAPAESHWLRTLEPAAAVDAFYRLWTAKEACLKCLGTGIGSGVVTLDDVACAIGPGGTIGYAARRSGPEAWHVLPVDRCRDHVAAVAVTANILFSLALMPVLGAAGLALATALAAMINGAILIIVLNRRLGGVEWGSVGRSSLRVVLACLPLIGICFWAASAPLWTHPGEWIEKAVVLAVAIVFSVGGYVGVHILLKSDEVDVVWGMVRRKLGRATGR